jgi:hypothetical protein
MLFSFAGLAQAFRARPGAKPGDLRRDETERGQAIQRVVDPAIHGDVGRTRFRGRRLRRRNVHRRRPATAPRDWLERKRPRREAAAESSSEASARLAFLDRREGASSIHVASGGTRSEMRFIIVFSSSSFSSMEWNLFEIGSNLASRPRRHPDSSDRVYSERVRAPAASHASLTRSYSAWVSRKTTVRDFSAIVAWKECQDELAKAGWAPSIVPTKLRSISTATARCNNSTLITTRYPDFSRVRIPSRPDRALANPNALPDAKIMPRSNLPDRSPPAL